MSEISNYKTLRSYYAKNYDKIFNNILFPNQRFFRIKKFSGKFIKSKNNITKPSDLKRLLLENTPSSFYMSVGRWYNPTKHYGKHIKRSCNKIADSILLELDLFFDVDHEDIVYALSDVRNIISYMDLEESKGYTLKSIQFSGSKGFHILYSQNNKIIEADPLLRIEKYKLERKLLVNKMLEYFKNNNITIYTFDDNHISIICDPYRIYAVPFSIKSKSGLVVYPLTKEQILNLNIKEIKDLIPKVYSPGMGKKSQMTHVGLHTIDQSRPAFRHQYQDNWRSGLSHYPITYSYFDNVVHGVKGLYVPVLKYKYSIPLERLLRVQEKYNLTSLYILKSHFHYYIICLKTVSYDRLIKIMKYAKAQNLNDFMYRKHSWINITDKLITDKVLLPKPKIIKTIVPLKILSGSISGPHKMILEKVFDAHICDYNMCIGEGGAIGSAYVSLNNDLSIEVN